jgi:hypothetical protein
MIDVDCFRCRFEVHSRKQTLTRRYARGLSLKGEANPSDFSSSLPARGGGSSDCVSEFPPLLAGEG